MAVIRVSQRTHKERDGGDGEGTLFVEGDAFGFACASRGVVAVVVAVVVVVVTVFSCVTRLVEGLAFLPLRALDSENRQAAAQVVRISIKSRIGILERLQHTPSGPLRVSVCCGGITSSEWCCLVVGRGSCVL